MSNAQQMKRIHPLMINALGAIAFQNYAMEQVQDGKGAYLGISGHYETKPRSRSYVVSRANTNTQGYFRWRREMLRKHQAESFKEVMDVKYAGEGVGALIPRSERIKGKIGKRGGLVTCKKGGRA